jgi:glutamate N-acetyltransferase / amino-acid N-acetyltransferase
MSNQSQEYKINILESGSITSPNGFYSSAVACGIKKNNAFDLGLLYSENPCSISALFTQNKLNGDSLKWTKNVLKNNNHFKAIIVNSGNANTSVGKIGLEHAQVIAENISKKLAIDPSEVCIASTGIIGIELPIEKIKNGIQKLQLHKTNGGDFSNAILTTDTRNKEIAVEIQINDKVFVIAGTAKGAGMIHPNLATMLAFITTDLNIEKKWADKILSEIIDDTFNMIDIDMDTSPCDMVMLMSQANKNQNIINEKHAFAHAFKEGLYIICEFLAKEIARDGEGATKLIETKIESASNIHIAKNAARSVISSILIKTMVKGKDPNWGRIITALGNTLPQLNEEKISIKIGDISVYEKGAPMTKNSELAISAMNDEIVTITINLNAGHASATAWGCDLTEEYVKINSEMTT